MFVSQLESSLDFTFLCLAYSKFGGHRYSREHKVVLQFSRCHRNSGLPDIVLHFSRSFYSLVIS